MDREVARLLDELADRISQAHDRAGQAMAGAVVSDLEALVGPGLGPADDPWVVIGRRFARVHRLLLAQDPTALLVQRLDQHLAALDDPAGAMLSAWLERHQTTSASSLDATPQRAASRGAVPR